MSELAASLAAYRREVERFRWEVPDAFNFGRDVVDAFAAADPRRPALLWRNAHGSERRLGFGEVAADSNRAARTG